MKLPYDKNPGRQFMPQNVAGTRCRCVCVCQEVYACVCVCSCQTNEMCQKQRQNSRSRWRPFDLFTRNWHTHTHRHACGGARAFWKFDIFQFSLLSELPVPACLHFMMATPITTDANFCLLFFLFFLFFHFFFSFIFLSKRKLLKCHTDISYSMHTYAIHIYLSVCVCVSRIYLSFHTRSEANEKYANEIVTQFLKRGAHCYFICMRMSITLKYNAIHEIGYKNNNNNRN